MYCIVLEDKAVKMYCERKYRLFHFTAFLLENTLCGGICSCADKESINAYESSTMDFYKCDLLLSLPYNIWATVTSFEAKMYPSTLFVGAKSPVCQKDYEI
jgi:hypothetical protein